VTCRNPTRRDNADVAPQPVERVWRCHQPGVLGAYLVRGAPNVATAVVVDRLARVEACWRVGQDGHSVAQVATAFGVSWATVMAAVRDHGAPLFDDPGRLAGVSAVGVDETAFLKSNAHRGREAEPGQHGPSARQT